VELHGQISDHLDSADIILLLVSADFLSSDYCYDIEMKRAMERHERSDAHVIPVILRPCDWKFAPFGKLMAVPQDGKPVVKFPMLDDGFVEVVQAVRQVVESQGSLQPPVATSLEKSITVSPDQRAPRSSNLRIKKEFTDRERHRFLTETFDYVARYFENSLIELQSRNAEVEAVFRQKDGNSFDAIAFVRGREKSRCGIWLGGLSGASGISFSYDGVGNANSYNEYMSVFDDGYTQSMKPLGMAYFGQRQNTALTQEGAAEYYWSLFVERLRQ
jgi:hypothetical protein